MKVQSNANTTKYNTKQPEIKGASFTLTHAMKQKQKITCPV